MCKAKETERERERDRESHEQRAGGVNVALLSS